MAEFTKKPAEITCKQATSELKKWLSNFLVKTAEKDGHIDALDVVQNFSSWVGKESKHSNPTKLLTTYAILEVAQHLFNMGAGFTRADLTSFTMKAILETVQRVEENINTLLKEPLNSAIEYFLTAIREIKNGSLQDGYKSFSDVIGNATKAFHYACGQGGTKPFFQKLH